MNSMELVRHGATGTRPRPLTEKRSTPRFCTELAAPVRSAILRARQFLIAERRGDGLWQGIQPSDAALTSLLIFRLAYTGDENSELAQQCAATILELQTNAGGWSRGADATEDVSASVQCYFALKLLGIDPSSERLSTARKRIRQLGGADVADAVTRYILALFGQIDYDCCPAVSTETPLFRDESGNRGPFTIIALHRPVRAIGVERGARELFIAKPYEWRESQGVGHDMNRIEAKPVAQFSSDRIEQLHFDELVWHAIALESLGFTQESEALSACETRMRALVHVDEDANTGWPQLATTPLADTAVVVRSLLASGMSPNHLVVSNGSAALCDAASRANPAMATELSRILLALQPAGKKATTTDDALPPEFEVFGEWSEDDDTEFHESRGDNAGDAQIAGIVERLLQVQRPDGGWGESDSAAVVTSAALEALCVHAADKSQWAIDRAIDYLRSTQHADGSWANNSDAGQVQATSAAVYSLVAAGVLPDDIDVAAGINWLLVHQQADGGWNDLSRDDDQDAQDHGAAPPTAWALLALVAAGKASHRAARRGVEFLLDAQDDEGRWFGNDLHSVAWPLQALSLWALSAISAQSEATSEMSLRLVSVSAED
jgi:squalene-hopene/tetraprenyl-beta-curcumene cyclase